jgi:competence protein ComEC
MLVVSHDDDDHAGGAASVAQLLTVRGQVASGRALDLLGPVRSCRAGQHWTWDGVRFDWLHPIEPLLPGDNDRSCVLAIRAGPRLLVLTGDVEKLAERQLLARGLPGPVDILVVPHHGSRTSSSAEFVAATRPRWAVVSAGHRNRWGFPAPAIVERWRASGAEVVLTSNSGAVEFEVVPGRPLQAPVRWRLESRRIWTDP